ncbi:MAG: NTP transferase domain-containing protein, partial [Pseudomonadota bacterium]
PARGPGNSAMESGTTGRPKLSNRAGFPGPLAGVLAGLDWAAGQGADSVISVAADTPFFPTDLVSVLRKKAEGMAHPLVLAATPRGEEKTKSMSRSGLIRHPTFGLWPVALRDDLRSALTEGLRKVVLWTEKHGGREAVFSDDGDPFFNVNTPEDLAQAQVMLGEQA